MSVPARPHRPARLAWLLLVLALLAGRPALGAVTQPHPGLTLVKSSNRATLVIDLCAAGVAVRATKYAERKKTAQQWGQQIGLQAAINADFFDFPAATLVNGRARGAWEDWPAGKQWVQEKDRPYWQFGPNLAQLVDNGWTPPGNASEIVGGHVHLIADGKPLWPFVSGKADGVLIGYHRRTGIGLSKDRRTMLWTVVNTGATGEMLGNYMLADAAAAGAPAPHWASSVDGGGSSQMWLQNGGFVVPSTRLVANHLGVWATGQGAPANCVPKVTCKPHCEGSVVVNSDCSKGDCAPYAAQCVDDELGARCASVFCPAKGEASVCVPGPTNGLIGTCKNGALSTGDCGAFGAYCSTALGPAKCISAFCVASPTAKPVAKDVCLPDGQRYACSSQGDLAAKPCPAGQKCATVNGAAVCQGGCQPHCEGAVMVGSDCGKGDCSVYGATCVQDDLGLRCVSVFCPAKGDATVCLPDPKSSKIGTCKNGAISVGECGAYGAWCSTALGPAKCVSAFCAASPTSKPVAKDVCLPDGKRYACDAQGNLAAKPCAAGQKCVTSAGGAVSCTGACQPHCEGTVIVGADCGKGDCGAFAASCVDDELGVRCASNFCPSPKGSASVCLDFIKPGTIGFCNNGALSTGDCGVYGAYCSTAVAGGAKCVSVFCATSATAKPVEKDVCLPDGKRYHCAANGDIAAKPCGSGEKCVTSGGSGLCQGPTCAPKCQGTVMVGADCKQADCASQGLVCANDALGLRCVHPKCPPTGVADVCLGGGALGHCSQGQLIQEDCAKLGATCLQTVTGPACVSTLCAPDGQVPKEDKHLCLPEGRVLCQATGAMVPAPCPGGAACNACGGCGAAPVEACNGLDDDCDGVTDDGVSCGGAPGEEQGGGSGADAGGSDAGGEVDAGTTDAGEADAGGPDGGEMDAGEPDAFDGEDLADATDADGADGELEAGGADALLGDTAEGDATAADRGPVDAPAGADAVGLDAGAFLADAAAGSGPGPGVASGCSAAQGGGAAGTAGAAGVLAACAAVIGWWRRRSATSR